LESAEAVPDGGRDDDAAIHRRERSPWPLPAGLAPEATRLPFHPMPRALQNDPRWQDATYGFLRRELFHRFQRAAPSWHTKLVATQEVRYKRFGRPPVRDAPSNQR